MVEGPGCKVKGENLNKRICNQKLIRIQSDDSKNTKKLGGDKTFQNSFESFVQSTVFEVRTLGKELFIFFKENVLCIRVHFLMDGYIRMNEAANAVGLKGSSKSAVLVIYLSRDTVAIYNSHVDIRLYEDCLVRYNKLCQLDICSSEFDFPCANKLISSRPGKMVCDVIMDQDVLPGVGNIIKNEALFNSGINPNSTIGELTADLVSRLVHRLRDFSAIFYKCRKENKALSRYMKIYKKERCGECGGGVTVCKPGELKRITYFCASCQTNSVSNLPSTGSLLGFVANSPITKEWACGRCTYINTYPSLVCAVCLQPNVDSKVLCQTNTSNKGGDSSCMHTEPVSSDRHSSWPEPMLYNRKRQSNESEEYKQEKMPKLKATISEQGKENRCNKNTKKVSENVSNKHKQSLVFASPSLPTVPVCLGHKVTCIKKQVTKASENQGRLFFVCSLPRLKQCHFFQWADLHHPLCAHKKVTVLRSVLKQNANNGRQFYCCPLPKLQQCDFFQWFS